MRGLLQRLFKSKFIHNTSWIMFAQIYQMLLSLVIGVISARYLGPSNYGTINYAASYISFFTIACALGLEGIVVKEMVDNRNNEGVVLGSSIVMRLVAGFFSMIAVCVIVAVVNPDDKLLLIVTFLQSLVLLFNAFHIIDTWYQSYLRSKISTIIRCIAYTGMSVYRVWLLITGKSVEWFAFSTSLDALIIAVLFVIKYAKDGSQKLKFDRSVSKHLIGLSYHLIIAYLMSAVYNQMDRLMIGKIIDQTHVGYYAAASTICHMWLFIPQALANSARPIIMQVKSENEQVYIRRLQQLSCAIFWLGIVFALAVSLLSHFIIDILYGAAYREARGALLFMIWSTVFSAMSNPRAIWMISENKQRYNKYILLCGVVVNLFLNGMLIPIIGINGAAFATLITELVCCFIAPNLIKETRPYVRYMIQSLNPIKLIRNN